ncbi:hypothetical protein [Roseiconus lacunae]|uniref:Tail terminator n=1 Tax=Roseiconus lacunae TaxID=2605694 RepID=A0ABT7PE67_9BACT|nr:hypothetical protein [Roseiconus lacunae]MDM4014633.1 hypothetical protein [Roseiconus lacunae]
MSRASDVRDALATELRTLLGPDQPVDRFIVPRFKREELVDGPRVVVRVGGRQLSMEDGPDTTEVSIEVGVVGVLPDAANVETTFAEAEIEACDSYDELLETIIAFWMNDGPLAYAGIADHFPVAIEQAIQFDASKLYSEGVYLTMIRITYRDSEDE